MGFNSKLFYTRFKDSWERDFLRIRCLENQPDNILLKNATLLPLRRRKDISCKAFEGGVINEKGTFIGGVQRSKRNFQLQFSCTKGYKPQVVRKSDEKVVFGGVIFGHFGHIIIDSSTRLWHYAENSDDGLKRIFVATPETTFKYGKLFDLAGMDWEIVEEPTQCAEVVVPEETFFSSDCGHPVWLKWWDFLAERARATAINGPYFDKIYLTRTQFAGNDGINEEFYEKYYAKLGFKVISPEKLPLEEQINVISHAKQIVSTMGTLAHLLVFARNDADVTILLREPSTIMRSQLVINKLKGFSWRCIEATINPLPTSQSNGTFLYGPTPQFREYCHDVTLPQPEEFTPTPEMLTEYLRKWTTNYTKMLSWHYIQKTPCVDFLASLSYFLTGTEIDKKAYADYKY